MVKHSRHFFFSPAVIKLVESFLILPSAGDWTLFKSGIGREKKSIRKSEKNNIALPVTLESDPIFSLRSRVPKYDEDDDDDDEEGARAT